MRYHNHIEQDGCDSSCPVYSHTWTLDDALNLVKKEYIRALSIFRESVSVHEAFEILHEEVDELKAEVRDKFLDPTKIQREAIQVAAMALKFLVESGALKNAKRGE